jgi:nickel-dependent lactate racemase
VTEAHRDACRYLDSVYRSPIPARADIVIVSQGGAPKDRNLYQTQKALDNAKHAVKDGGTIIVVGSCSEGFGQDKFAEWMLKYRNPDDMLQALHEHFVLGGHKAAAIGLVRKKAQLFLVSDMDPETVKKTFFIPFKTLQEAYNCAAEKYGKNASVIVMPYGGSTLPCVKEDIHHEEKEG